MKRLLILFVAILILACRMSDTSKENMVAYAVPFEFGKRSDSIRIFWESKRYNNAGVLIEHITRDDMYRGQKDSLFHIDTISYTYKDSLKIERIKKGGAKVRTEYIYDRGGELTGVKIYDKNGLKERVTISEKNGKRDTLTIFNGLNNRVTKRLVYNYGDRGNINWILVDSPATNGKTHWFYEYDSLNNIVKTWYRDRLGNSFTKATHRIRYDENNRVVEKISKDAENKWYYKRTNEYYENDSLSSTLVSRSMDPNGPFENVGILEFTYSK